MSSYDECKKTHQSECSSILSNANKDAVFTFSQTEKIVQIASALDEHLFKTIGGLSPKDFSCEIKEMSRDVNKLECQVDGLIAYDEKNTEDIMCLETKVVKLMTDVAQMKAEDKTDDAKLCKVIADVAQMKAEDKTDDAKVSKLFCDVQKLEKEVDCVEKEMKSMSDKTAHALLSQANELNRVADQLDCVEKVIKAMKLEDKTDDAKVAKLVCELNKLEKEVECLSKKDYKDDRIEAILSMLSSMCTRAELCALEKADKLLQAEIGKIEAQLKKLACMEFKDSRVDSILKRLAILESKKFEDCRVDALMYEIAKLEKQLSVQEAVNARQQKSIDSLYSQNVRQSEDIKQLMERMKGLECKLDRNTIALDSKINVLEKEEYAEKKVDATQSAQIFAMQTQMSKMQNEIDRLEKAILIKPC